MTDEQFSILMQELEKIRGEIDTLDAALEEIRVMVERLVIETC